MNNLPKPILKGFIFWLRECYSLLGRHGWDLVEHNAKVAYGKYATFPADVDDDLLRAEALGWIKRGKICPTSSQQVFLGLSYRSKIPKVHASCWFWEPASIGDPKRTEALAWLKEQESTRLGLHRCAKPGCLRMVDKPGDTCNRTDENHL